nr:7431_t:CDS:2 [Entrophospora candida]CAG8437252.1 12111_t:CDS:2 [Entrophospora candida]
MSYKTFVVKKVAKHVLSNNRSKQNAQDQDTQNIISSSSTNPNAHTNNNDVGEHGGGGVGGKRKKNKWKIPPNLTQKEAKVLKHFKKRAYCYDVSCCNCCGIQIGLDPIIAGYL